MTIHILGYLPTFWKCVFCWMDFVGNSSFDPLFDWLCSHSWDREYLLHNPHEGKCSVTNGKVYGQYLVKELWHLQVSIHLAYLTSSYICMHRILHVCFKHYHIISSTLIKCTWLQSSRIPNGSETRIPGQSDSGKQKFNVFPQRLDVSYLCPHLDSILSNNSTTSHVSIKP